MITHILVALCALTSGASPEVSACAPTKDAKAALSTQIEIPVSYDRCVRDFHFRFWKEAGNSCLDAADDWATEAGRHPTDAVYTFAEAKTRFMLAVASHNLGLGSVTDSQEIMAIEEVLSLYNAAKSDFVKNKCLELIEEIKDWDKKAFLPATPEPQVP